GDAEQVERPVAGERGRPVPLPLPRQEDRWNLRPIEEPVPALFVEPAPSGEHVNLHRRRLRPPARSPRPSPPLPLPSSPPPSPGRGRRQDPPPSPGPCVS